YLYKTLRIIQIIEIEMKLFGNFRAFLPRTQEGSPPNRGGAPTPMIFDCRVWDQAISTIASISTVMEDGNDGTPMDVRTCLPAAPRDVIMTAEAASSTSSIS